MRLKLLGIFAFATFAQAESMSFTEYVSVSSSTPQYENISSQIPYQDCSTQRVLSSPSNSRRSSDMAAASVLGGAIGGVIGHQIGKGKGNDIATIGGAILGTMVGANAVQDHSVYSQPRYSTKQNCVTKYRQGQTQRRLNGYRNIGYYKGQKIVKYSDMRLSSIPVTITIDY